jgi:hypothetical protein
MHPDWDYRLHTSTQGFPETVQRVIDSIDPPDGSKWSSIADVIRYWMLWKFGGVAVDADSECLRPLDDRFLTPVEWACWENEQHCPGQIANGAMGARAGSLLMARLVQRLEMRDPEDSAFRSFGPHFLTELAHGYRDLTIYPSRYFTPWHYKKYPAPGDYEVFARQFWGSTKGSHYERMDLTDPNLVVVSTGGEIPEWAPGCVQSVLSQTVAARHIVVSHDPVTLGAALDVARTHARGCLVQSEVGYQCAIANLLLACSELDESKIVVWLDLDDQFAVPWALEYLRDLYVADPSLDATYGSCREWPAGTWSWPPYGYHADVVARGTYRRAEMLCTHLRTFRVSALRRIPMRAFRDSNETNVDQLVMLPLLELTRERARFVPHVLVDYNTRNLVNKDPEYAAAEVAENDRLRALEPVKKCSIEQYGPSIVVVSTGSRIPEWAPKCVESVRAQSIEARHIVVAGNAETREAIVVELGDSVHHVRFVDCLGDPLQNVDTIVRDEDPDTVVVWLDLDDWLACPEALAIVRHVYRTTDALMTYGSYRDWPSRKWGMCNGEYSSDVVRANAYRSAPWTASHLRTFRAGHYQRLTDEDLRLPDGSWHLVRDFAVMLPLLELSGGRHKYIPEQLCWYNTRNLPYPPEVRAREVAGEKLIRAMKRRLAEP